MSSPHASAVSPARLAAWRALVRLRGAGGHFDDSVEALPELQGLDPRDRGLANEIIVGTIKRRWSVDAVLGAFTKAPLAETKGPVLEALRIATFQLLFLDRVPAYAAVDDAVATARAFGGQKLAGFSNAVLRKVSTVREPALPAGLLDRLEIEHSLPRWILDELAATLGPASREDGSLAARAAAFNQHAPLVARANLLRGTREALAEELRAAGVEATAVDLDGPGTPAALRLDGIGDPGHNPSFLAGRWTVQDAGAQLVAQLARPHAGQRILDACAGVGGKATHLAELADDAAHIDAADRSATKLDLAAATAQRLGITSLHRHVCDLTDPKAPLARDYDLIVLDAPCTGLGVLRRHPDAKWRLIPDDVPRLARVQAELLDAVAARLSPTGALIYSVCTFTRAEGPDQARAFAERSGLRLVVEHRTWPPDADAFYLARFER